MATEYFEEKEKRWSDVRNNFSTLLKEIPTEEILSYLGNCLYDAQMQKFRRLLGNTANAHINYELLDGLRCHRYWWRYLTNALIKIRKQELLTLMGWSTEFYDQESIESSINRRQNASRRVEHRGSDGSGRTGDLTNNFADRQRSNHGRQCQVARDYSEPAIAFVPEENIHREEAAQNDLVHTSRREVPSRARNQEYTNQVLESREDSNFRETASHNARPPHDAKNQVDPGRCTGEESTDTGIEAISEESATSKTKKNNQQTSPEDNNCQWPNRSSSRVSKSIVPSNNTHWPNEGDASIQDQKLKVYQKQKNLLDSVTQPRATSEHPPLSSNLACNLDEEKHPETSKDKIMLPNIQSEEKTRMSKYIKEATNELKQLNIEHSDVHANENPEPIPTMSSPDNNEKQYDSSEQNNLNGNSLKYLKPKPKQEPHTEHRSKSSPSEVVCVDDKTAAKSSLLLHNNDSFNFQNDASAPKTPQPIGAFTSMSSIASSTSTTLTINLDNKLSEVNVARLISETLPGNDPTDASDPSNRILQGNHRNDTLPSSVGITSTEILPLTDPDVSDPCRTATTSARVASDELFVPVSTTCSDRSDASDNFQNAASAAPCAPKTSQSIDAFTSISTSTTSTIDLHNESLEVNVARLIPQTLPENGPTDASVPDTSDPSSRMLQGNHRIDTFPSSVRFTTEILPLTDPDVSDTAATSAMVASNERFVPVSTTVTYGDRNASESGDRATSIDLDAALENRNRFSSMGSSLSSIHLSYQHASISISRIFNDSGVRRSFSSAVYDTIFR